MQTIELSHGLIHYQYQGTGEPLILLHGWGGSSRYWQQTMEFFAPFRRVYLFDLPGYGESPPLPQEEISAERFARVIIEAADQLGIEQFELNAHSFGSSIAILIAANYPERVRKLVLTCFSTFSSEMERRMVEQLLSQMGLSVAMWQPWMALWHPWMAFWQSWISLLQPPPVAASVPTVYQSIAWRFFYSMPTNDSMLRDFFQDFLKMDQVTSLQSIMSVLKPEINDAMRRILAPTLLVASRQDMIMPPSGVPIVAQLIPKCRLEWIEHCGHLPMIERPSVYHKLIRSFLT